MTEEIKYYKEKEYPLKWIPAEEMEETPQQTIARLEQENKELKKQIESQKGLITVGGKQQYEYLQRIDALEQERDELKIEINTLKADKRQIYLTAQKDINELKQKNKELKKQIESQKGLITVGCKQQYDMTMAYDKCKTVLEEIREIIRADCKMCTAECDCDEDCTRYMIKNKINEVLK